MKPPITPQTALRQDLRRRLIAGEVLYGRHLQTDPTLSEQDRQLHRLWLDQTPKLERRYASGRRLYAYRLSAGA